MESVKDKLQQLVLQPKKEQLILGLVPVVTGLEPSFKPGLPDPQYFEIWFYHAFDFNYTVIGWNNFCLDLSTSTDEKIVNMAFEEFRWRFADEIEADNEFIKLKRELEFEFFAECWAELENRVNKGLRCFLIEHGTIKGIDVNRRKNVECEAIAEILNSEGIPNSY